MHRLENRHSFCCRLKASVVPRISSNSNSIQSAISPFSQIRINQFQCARVERRDVLHSGVAIMAAPSNLNDNRSHHQVLVCVDISNLRSPFRLFRSLSFWWAVAFRSQRGDIDWILMMFLAVLSHTFAELPPAACVYLGRQQRLHQPRRRQDTDWMMMKCRHFLIRSHTSDGKVIEEERTWFPSPARCYCCYLSFTMSCHCVVYPRHFC